MKKTLLCEVRLNIRKLDKVRKLNFYEFFEYFELLSEVKRIILTESSSREVRLNPLKVRLIQDVIVHSFIGLFCINTQPSHKNSLRFCFNMILQSHCHFYGYIFVFDTIAVNKNGNHNR